MRSAPAAATTATDHSANHGVTPEPRLPRCPSMGAAIVRGHNLDIFVPKALSGVVRWRLFFRHRT